jgi:predicted GIY-YIG superfamily endonuclease
VGQPCSSSLQRVRPFVVESLTNMQDGGNGLVVGRSFELCTTVRVWFERILLHLFSPTEQSSLSHWPLSMEPAEAGCFACYLLRSQSRPAVTYIGFTVDPHRRLRQHNGATVNGAKRTSRNRPWSMVCCVFGFPSKLAALQFEWAWQHPQRTRSLRDADSTEIRGTGYLARLAALQSLLKVLPWANMQLGVVCQDRGIASRFASASGPAGQDVSTRGWSALVQAAGSRGLDVTRALNTPGSIPVLAAGAPASSASASSAVVGPSAKGVVRALAHQWRFAVPPVTAHQGAKCSCCGQSHDRGIGLRWARCCNPECSAVFHVQCAARETLQAGRIMPHAVDCKLCMARIPWRSVVGQHTPTAKPAAEMPKPAKRTAETAPVSRGDSADEQHAATGPKRPRVRPAAGSARPPTPKNDSVIDLLSP